MSEEPRVHLSRSAPEAYQALAAFSKTVGGTRRRSRASTTGCRSSCRCTSRSSTAARTACASTSTGPPRRASRSTSIAQLPVWRESGVFSDRERAGLELAEAFTFIHEEGIPDDVYDRVGGILSEKEYVALSWILVSINAFNRIAIAGRYHVPPRDDLSREDSDAASGTAW